MSRIFGLYITVILILGTSAAFSQIKSFGTDPKIFIGELERHMNSGNQESAKKAFLRFKAHWDANAYGEEVYPKIIKACNEMLRKRMRQSPEFEEYLNTMSAFVETGNLATHFADWQKLLESYYKGSSKSFLDFLLNSNGILSSRTFESSASRAWQFTSSEFKFRLLGEQAALEVGNTDLICVSTGDSMIVYNTKGVYRFDTKIWNGDGGKVNWQKAGLEPDKVFAALKRYEINAARGEYIADSASLTHPEYFGGTLLGRYQDKALAALSDPERASYPRFNSYKNDISIGKFIKEAEYRGGFGLEGSKVIASGTGDNPGTFTFFYKKAPIIILSSKRFVVSPERLVTDQAELRVILNKDSNAITHPRVRINYVAKERKLTATRGKEGITQAPFMDDYHKLEILADEMVWIVDQPKVDFSMILKDAPARFASLGFFREFNYEKIQGMLATNPLQDIKLYCDKKGVKQFYLKDYAAYRNSKEENLIPQFIELNDDGFITFNPETRLARVNEKLFNYVNAHMGRTDYDIIRFESIIEKLPNASVNFENNNMQIEGVGRLRFSDSQYVYAIPKEQRLTVKKDRGILFDGKVRAGRMEFFGRGYEFNYTNFTVDMEKVDSLVIFFPDENDMLVKVGSVLEDINGTLFIDQQYNKSGRVNFPEYPIFKSRKGSKVYYDQKITFGGVYDRERFYFDVDPFTIDSLDNFTRSGLNFHGTFVAGGIIPDVREKLVVMKDYSLGFERTDAVPVYMGKGNGRLKMALSNEGFFGNGEVEFASSVSKADTFFLFLDSMNAFVKTFELAASTKAPKVSGANVYTHWEPYKDDMKVKSGEKPFALYDNAKFDGTLTLSSTQLRGNGGLDFDDALIASRDMKLETRKMKADTSSLQIRSVDPTKFAFESQNVRSQVDFDKRIGEFKSNVDGATSKFPYNQYIASLNEFRWEIDKKRLKFMSPPGTIAQQTYFMSIHPEQDSLWFNSAEATYDLQTFVLTADKVPYIGIADSRLMPDSQRVVIRQNAAMDPLKNAKMLVDTIQKFHNLYEVEALVGGKYNITAKGYYDYKDRSGKKNKIFFSNIKVDFMGKYITAGGKVLPGDDYTLAPRMRFKGDVFLRGAYRGLYYDGHFLADHGYEQPMTWWTRVKDRLVADSMYIRLEAPINEDQKELFTGFAIAPDSGAIYPTLLSRKRVPGDPEVLNVPSGIFYYDDAKQTFYFGDSAKLFDNALAGSMYSLNIRDGIAYGEGNAGFTANLEKVELRSAGKAEQRFKDNRFKLDLAMILDFGLPADAVKIMRTNIEGNTGAGIKPSYSGYLFRQAMSQMLSAKDAQRVLNSASKGEIELVSDLRKMMVLNEVSFRWSQSQKSFMSTGNAEIIVLGGEKLERTVEAKIQVEKKRSGDEITIYLEDGGGTWFYFNYLRGNMYTLSSSEDYNLIIRDQAGKASKDGYYLRQATQVSVSRFIRNFDAE